MVATSQMRDRIVTIHQDWEKADIARLATVAQDEMSWFKDHVHPPAMTTMPLSKRVFDITLALLALVPLSIVMAAFALILLVVQGRPIFYAAPRMAAPGRTFTHLKFRTMLRQEGDFGVTGAHKAWRITPLGHFMRRTRIDELPQLFNILKGDMSFVGPRPTIREYVERYPAVYGQVLKSRPGVTGLATLIYHRHEDRILRRCKSAEATEAAYARRCLPTKLKIDLIYQRNRTLALDLWIIWRTVLIVLYKDERPRRRGRK
ncbi:lipopolysaccharide/colanic/teichoic acid biosynthesis glycosyltransferase [Paracoccus pantotrophus]|uniref:Lipopolysaccharide/colanic/teichoic acid biosynthesis glycosyltransferase n=2 Tax=Paracoccaceae TaxID=31989 RepID=A0ABX9SEY0_PARPN|nr:lipopolysaccharide/colanic/teichoic acid biosynthesis glycosyltransferase [Paracoccus pantotrophus]SFO08787.1 Sugar transferase involved in LPS biosynthesis (colanic, teichoic acid) [Paracoccus pantotrophus]